jgi:AraC-like DNA-binding protein
MNYTTGQVVHHGICASFRVFAPAGETPKHAEHAGWELNFLPTSRPLQPHSHPQQLQLRGRQQTIDGSRVLFFNALEPHCEIYSPTSDSHLNAVVILPEFLRPLLDEHGLCSRELVFDSHAFDKDRLAIDRLKLIMDFREIRDSSRVAFDGSLTELVLHLLLNYRNSSSHRLTELSRTGHFPSAIAKARKALAEHAFDENFDLQALAKLVGMSKFHLIETFRRATGLTPIRYRNQLRLEEAKRRLKLGSQAIADVATAIGYRDLSTFHKAFRAHTGLSAGAYRSLGQGSRSET